MKIQYINTQDALFYILDERRFPHLLECIKGEREVRYDKRNDRFDVVLLNGRDFEQNTYTDPYSESKFWLAGFSDDNPDDCVMLQLVHTEDHTVELVNIEKHTEEKDVFGQVVRFIDEHYSGCSVETFPMNDCLKDYYMGFGFEEKNGILVRHPERC